MAPSTTHAVGKRKTSIARVWLKPGKGDVVINKRELGDYMLRPTARMIINQPFELTGTSGKYDVIVNVIGGGLSGQAEAIRHGITRALSVIDADFRVVLKKAGLITRDSRKKERKLPGQPSSRARFQFSKR
jgi:small subunit ribosomal protein S9